MVETGLARFAKAAFIFDFQFIIISFAIWGIGLGALLVYYFFKNLGQKRLRKLLMLLTFSYSVLLLLPFFVITQQFIEDYSILKQVFFSSNLIVFTLAGIIISLIFRYYSNRISQLYSVSLIGGAIGALSTSFLLNLLGISKFVIIVFAFSLFSSLLLSVFFNLRRLILPISLLLILIFIWLSLPISEIFYVNCERFKNRESEELLMNDSNSFAQLSIYQKKDAYQGGQLTADEPFLIRMRYNCRGGTKLLEFNKTKNYDPILNDIVAFPMSIKDYRNIAVLGAGAGVDVVRASLLGIKEIDAIEINPLIPEWVDRLDENNIYKSENVNLVISEARSYISRSNKTYDLIIIPRSKSFGEVGIAPYAFVQNYLFTKEAITTYFEHLTDDGIFSIVDQPSLVDEYTKSLADYLLENGKAPEDHMVLVEGRDAVGPKRTSIIIKKNGFTDNEKQNLKSSAEKRNLSFKTMNDVDYSSGKLATDNRPFFWGVKQSLLFYGFSVINNLYKFLIALVAIFFGIITLPFIVGKKKPSINSIPLLIYFASIGIGFIILQLFTIEKITFFLGNPIFSLSIVLSSFLLFCGIGSIITKRIRSEEILSKLKILSLLFLVILAVYVLTIHLVIDKLSFLALPYKILLSLMIIIIPAVISGMLFPLGLRIAKSLSKDMIPWMWAIDGIATMIGGVMFVIISFYLGFLFSFFIAMLFYFVIFTSAFLMDRKLKPFIH